MRKLLLLSLISIGVVGALALWARHVLEEIENRGKALAEEYETRVAALRELDGRFPARPAGALDPARFASFLRARSDAARTMRNRFAEEGKSAFHARATRNVVLERLHASLVEEMMGPAEYRAISDRFLAVLAASGDARLEESWNRDTAAGNPRRPLPLPEPAKDATRAELALLEQHRDALAESMTAGLLRPLLARTAGE